MLYDFKDNAKVQNVYVECLAEAFDDILDCYHMLEKYAELAMPGTFGYIGVYVPWEIAFLMIRYFQALSGLNVNPYSRYCENDFLKHNDDGEFTDVFVLISLRTKSIFIETLDELYEYDNSLYHQNEFISYVYDSLGMSDLNHLKRMGCKHLLTFGLSEDDSDSDELSDE